NQIECANSEDVKTLRNEIQLQVLNTDWKDYANDALAVLPAFRGKRLRHYPRRRPEQDIVFLIWPNANPDSQVRNALQRLCEKVIRIGHSSSLVQMWVEDHPPRPNLEPDDIGEERLRVAGSGTMKMLASSYNRDAIELWADLKEQIANAKGKAKAALKDQVAERFGKSQPRSLRPTISRWQGYRRIADEDDSPKGESGAFDANLMVLNMEDGPVLGLESTWQLLTAMHKTILKHCDPTPEWLSGHQGDGSPSESPHLALMPLAFVGRDYADGHIMGIGLAFPKNIELREQGRALSALLYDADGLPQNRVLKLGLLGSCTLSRETRPSPPVTLRVSNWVGPSDTWASVTPIVLDRHPKTERAKDRQQWSLEVADVIAGSFERQGLPRPIGIDVDKTSWFRGAPRAVAGNGSGFPLMPVKEGRPKRQQVHVWLKFDRPVSGPLLLGAGRYRGYGVCRPWRGQRR
ncbi:MAG: type I-U CRISPR-associated protein Csb2, partial [Planctomycetaceae bacterium]